MAEPNSPQIGAGQDGRPVRRYARPPGAEAMEGRERAGTSIVARSNPAESRALRRPTASAWLMTAWIASVFLLLVGVTMIIDDGRIRRDDPLKSVRLKEYHDKLRLDPVNESLKAEIRKLDLELRSRYFRHLSRKESGVYLLLGGASLLILAMSQNRKLTRELPAPILNPDASAIATRTATMSRWSVAAISAAIGVFLFISSLGLTTTLPRRTAQIEKLLGIDSSEDAVSASASADELKNNWIRFRGPEGGGFACSVTSSAVWDGPSGTAIAWKVPTPANGHNSPIVWHERLYFSGASQSERMVFCLDAATGKMLWHASAPGSSGTPASRSDAAPNSNLAGSTMTTDGRRVYAFFGNGDLATFTMDGKPTWSKALGPLRNAYGHASSLLIWKEKLILQLDQGEPEQGKSMLYAFDCRSGQILWQRPRRAGSSWATPIVIEAAGKAQLITLAVPSVIAYSVTDGAELWRVEGLNGEITPSPIFTAGLVLAISPSEKLLAIRPDGSGDVTKTHIAWSTDENIPDITSPVGNGELVFTLSTPGLLTCFNASDGKKQWEHDFEMEFHSSPCIAAGRLYLLSLKGTAIAVEAAGKFKELFRTEMPDVFEASPVLQENRIFLRGQTNIWCIGISGEKLARNE